MKKMGNLILKSQASIETKSTEIKVEKFSYLKDCDVSQKYLQYDHG